MNPEPTVVQLNALKLAGKVFTQIQHSYEFCYPNNTLDIDRVHPQLLKMGTYVQNYKRIIDLNEENKLNNPLVKYLYDLLDMVDKERLYAYPNKMFDDDRGHPALGRIKSLGNSFKIAIPTLIQSVITTSPADMYISVDIEKALDSVDIWNSYKYAYPKNLFDSGKSHPALQKLYGDVDMLNWLVEPEIRKEIPNSAVNTVITDLQNNMTQLKKNLHEAYPNNSLNADIAHEVLTKFTNNYKSTKVLYQGQFKMIKSLSGPNAIEIKEPGAVASKPIGSNAVEPNSVEVAQEISASKFRKYL